MPRRTKIIATLGPATDDSRMLDKIIQAGVDLVRINFSHGAADKHFERVERLRSRAAALGRQVGVLTDLQGPKIRIEKFRDGRIQLEEGMPFTIDAALGADAGDQEQVGTSYQSLPEDVQPGDNLLLDDGRLVLTVERTSGTRVICRVAVGGVLSDRKGINLQGGGLSAPALTDKDRADILLAAELQSDYMAVSFPRNAADIEEARKLLRAAGGDGLIVAKIERAEALPAMDEIILASDAIMVARGDLGVEIGDAALPPVQKQLIQRARTLNRVVITATQMMESMIENQIPTRAEVFDVANAVLDGTDAIMLSAETATGHYPDKAIAAMDRVCRETERQRQATTSRHRIDVQFDHVDEAVAMSAMYAANHFDVKAIAALTESGSTPLWMSRISSGIPIYALSRHLGTQRKVTLYRGVYPVAFDTSGRDKTELEQRVLAELSRRGAVGPGDRVIMTNGDEAGVHGGTNAMTIIQVGGG